ncbi:putative LRR receptor-like serine/threonine-protein kinase RLK [Apostasia shenzhenica]|uniref:Putative LRR receptor-like serine/threonine-protein kinase RLK n=1 Tax=Apostasia shenzhenica TaxID=1088818 RepID=A0A2I0APK6_9ASPA|nr:putative LRR receptor-like serine/threonine-protein kinase RLK [Apostasia shenzhenica]
MASQAVQRLLLLLLLSAAIPFSAAGPEEGGVLLRFKSTLPGLGAALRSWVSGATPCNANRTTWEGVICFNGHVWGIQLEDRGLAGGGLDLSPLADLRGLRTISFMRNSLEGQLPDLSRLGSLKAAYFSRNRFSGEIPDSTFAGMRSLKKLWLSENEFSGQIPATLAGLGKLMELRLDHNKFVGRIPDFRQPELEKADVSFNRLEGPIPGSLAKMHPGLFQGNDGLCGKPLSVSCDDNGRPKRRVSGWLVAAIILACIMAVAAAVLLFKHGRSSNKTADGGDVADKLEKGDDGAGSAAVAASKESTGAGKGGKRAAAVGGKKINSKENDFHGRLTFLQEGRDRFELHDLLRASAEVLGSGAFGSSYKAAVAGSGAVVVKRFKEMNGAGREDFVEHMRRLGRLSHPNLLPVVAYYYKEEEKLLVSDFVPYGSLARLLHGNCSSDAPALDWPAKLKIVKGVARGLAYLYDELPVLSLPHGHLKSSNVLLTDAFVPLLADYALAPVMNSTVASRLMVAYKSPEAAQFGRPSKKSDVWSFGILILEILTGMFPAADFHCKGPAGSGDIAAWVREAAGQEDELIDGEMRKTMRIALECCEEDVEKRLEMRDALERIEGLKDGDEGQ